MGDLPNKRQLESEGDTHGFRVNERLLVGGLIAVVLLIFIFSNNDEVPVSFLMLDWTVPLWFVLAGTALLGAAAGALLTHLRQRRKARRV
jgi:uncharacterized integral membrane protein